MKEREEERKCKLLRARKKCEPGVENESKENNRGWKDRRKGLQLVSEQRKTFFLFHGVRSSRTLKGKRKRRKEEKEGKRMSSTAVGTMLKFMKSQSREKERDTSRKLSSLHLQSLTPQSKTQFNSYLLFFIHLYNFSSFFTFLLFQHFYPLSYHRLITDTTNEQPN